MGILCLGVLRVPEVCLRLCTGRVLLKGGRMHQVTTNSSFVWGLGCAGRGQAGEDLAFLPWELTVLAHGPSVPLGVPMSLGLGSGLVSAGRNPVKTVSTKREFIDSNNLKSRRFCFRNSWIQRSPKMLSDLFLCAFLLSFAMASLFSSSRGLWKLQAHGEVAEEGLRVGLWSRTVHLRSSFCCFLALRPWESGCALRASVFSSVPTAWGSLED